MSNGIGLSDVKELYGGAQGDLFELIMGHQIHIGGFRSSMDLSERAGIEGAKHGIDLCCCTGAGMRFLTRFRSVGKMTGVDATESIIARGNQRTRDEGLSDRVTFVHADACQSGLPDKYADFVWGEDAWCYVVDKKALIHEAARITASGGTIAFTDWVEGEVPMSAEELDRFSTFSKIPNVRSIKGYTQLLEENQCEVKEASDTGRFASYIDLYLQMVDKQFTYDAMRILNFDAELLGQFAGEMMFLSGLAHAGKIVQGRFVAMKAAS